MSMAGQAGRDVLRAPVDQDLLLVGAGADRDHLAGHVLRFPVTSSRRPSSPRTPGVQAVGGEVVLLLALLGDGDVGETTSYLPQSMPTKGSAQDAISSCRLEAEDVGDQVGEVGLEADERLVVGGVEAQRRRGTGRRRCPARPLSRISSGTSAAIVSTFVGGDAVLVGGEVDVQGDRRRDGGASLAAAGARSAASRAASATARQWILRTERTPVGQRTLDRKALVRSCSGLSSTSRRALLDDHAASMKTTVSATSRAKPISWVTMTRVVPSRARLLDHVEHLADQFRVERRGRLVEEDDLGPQARARAIATRCCWPPESCRGYASTLSATPTRSRSAGLASPRRGGPAPRRRLDHVLQHGEVREQIEVLEDEADLRCAASGSPVPAVRAACSPPAGSRSGRRRSGSARGRPSPGG